METSKTRQDTSPPYGDKGAPYPSCDEQRGDSRRHHHRSRPTPVRHRFLWNLRFELLAIILSVLGVFLLVERCSIRSAIARWAIQTVLYARDAAVALSGGLSSIERSDIVGIALILCATGLIGYDVRSRILRRHEQLVDEPVCGKCGNHMYRSHSSRLQRVLAVLFRVRIRQFHCSACGRRRAFWQRPHESDW